MVGKSTTVMCWSEAEGGGSGGAQVGAERRSTVGTSDLQPSGRNRSWTQEGVGREETGY